MKLAILASHPVQYHALLFRRLAESPGVELTVFYGLLPDRKAQGEGFGVPFQWDIPLCEGYSFEVFTQDEKGDNLQALGVFFRLRKKLSAFDVILCTGWHHRSLFPAIAAAVSTGKPCLLRCEANLWKQRSWLKKMFHRGMLSLYEAVLPIGMANARYYEAFGIRAERKFASLYFVDNSRFAKASAEADREELRTRWGIPQNAFCFLFSGKLVKKKHPVDLVKALGGLADVHLLVVGSGELENELRAAAEEFEASCSFAGFLNQSEIPGAYAVADCLVLPSDGEETWGLVVNEAMACGRPVVVSDRVGCQEDLVVEGLTGLTFPSEDWKALRACLSRMATDRAASQMMGMEGRRRVEAYSADAAAKGVLTAADFVTRGQQRQSFWKDRRSDELPPREKGRLLVLAPTFGHESGGIQTFTRDITTCLAALCGPEKLVALSYEGSSPAEGIFAEWADAGGSRFRGLTFFFQALRLCRKWRPEGIVSTFPGFSPVAVVCARIWGIPFVTAAHGVEVWSRLPLWKRIGLQQADRILAVSRFTAERMQTVNGVSADRVRIFPNTVDLEHFFPGPKSQVWEQRLALSAGAPVLLTVARLEVSERTKGFFQIWKALQATPELDACVHLVVGEGNDRENLENEVRDRGLTSRVRFVGSVPPKELPELYRLADVFVMPSTQEGFGIVFLEAMASGVPVVAAAAGGTLDALRDGTLGWLADPESPESLVACLGAALSRDPKEPRCDQEFLRSSVEKYFGTDAFCRRLEAVFDEIMP